MRSTYTEHFKHGRLCFENRSSANGTDFDGRHGNADLESSIVATDVSELQKMECGKTYFFMIVIQFELSTF